MNKSPLSLLFLLLSLLLISCSPTPKSNGLNASTPNSSNQNGYPIDSATPNNNNQSESGYPSGSTNSNQSNNGYPTDNSSSGYPTNSSDSMSGSSSNNAYPNSSENLVWISKPAGAQCQDNPIVDLDTTLSLMENQGISVHQAKEVELMVCTACGCPTSAHYQLLIDASNLASVESLGWMIQP